MRFEIGAIMYIKWSENNELGIPIIDEQHRGIVSSINTLHYYLQDGQGMDALSPTFNIIREYTKIHFDTEEALLKKANYDDFENHILLHKNLTTKTNEISQAAIASEDPESALMFLKDWWIGHINKEDRKYALVLKEMLGIS